MVQSKLIVSLNFQYKRWVQQLVYQTNPTQRAIEGEYFLPSHLMRSAKILRNHDMSSGRVHCSRYSVKVTEILLDNVQLSQSKVLYLWYIFIQWRIYLQSHSVATLGWVFYVLCVCFCCVNLILWRDATIDNFEVFDALLLAQCITRTITSFTWQRLIHTQKHWADPMLRNKCADE